MGEQDDFWVEATCVDGNMTVTVHGAYAPLVWPETDPDGADIPVFAPAKE